MEPEEILDEKSFQDKYWFDNYVHITVANPTTSDFKFSMVVQTGIDRSIGKPREETRNFMVPAGGKERFVGSVANLYLDKMSKLLAQEARKFGDISDWNARAVYYDELIIDKDDPYNDAAYVSFDDAKPQGEASDSETSGQPFAAAKAAQAERERLELENAELRKKLAEQENKELREKLNNTEQEPNENVDKDEIEVPNVEQGIGNQSAVERPFAGVGAPTGAKRGRPAKHAE